MSKLLVCLLSVLTLLTACSDGDSDEGQDNPSPPVTPQPPTNPAPAENGSAILTGTELVISGISVPPPPTDASNTSPGGVDLNSNGVRDDAERLLVKVYGTNAQQLDGTMQLARGVNSILAPEVMDVATAQARVTASADEAQCIPERNFSGDFGAAERANNIVVGAMLNTPERIRRYQERVSLASSNVSIDFKRECK